MLNYGEFAVRDVGEHRMSYKQKAIAIKAAIGVVVIVAVASAFLFVKGQVEKTDVAYQPEKVNQRIIEQYAAKHGKLADLQDDTKRAALLEDAKNAKVELIVNLGDKTVASELGDKLQSASATKVAAVEADIKKAAQGDINRLVKKYGAKVIDQSAYLVNTATVEVKYDQVEAIAKDNHFENTGVNAYFQRLEGGDAEEAGKNAATSEATAAAGTGRGQVIAIIDDGVRANHENFNPATMDSSALAITKNTNWATNTQNLGHPATYKSSKIPYEYNYVNTSDTDGWETGAQSANYSHGTHVAGIASGTAANHKGVAPDAQILNMRLFDPANLEQSGGTNKIIAAIEDAVKLNADVINLSLGIAMFEKEDLAETYAELIADPYFANLYNTITTATAAGATVVAAAGNEGLVGAVNVPAAFDNVIAVGAANATTQVPCNFSSWRNAAFDNGHAKPDLLAKGQSVSSSVIGNNADSNGVGNSWPGTQYASKDGTSMATPAVSGAVAVYKELKPGKTTDSIKVALDNAATPSKTGDNYFSTREQGGGYIDLAKAVAAKTTLRGIDSQPLAYAAPYLGDSVTIQVVIKNEDAESVDYKWNNYGGVFSATQTPGTYTDDSTEGFKITDLGSSTLTKLADANVRLIANDVQNEPSLGGVDSVITVAAGESKTLTFQINTASTTEAAYTEGFIRFRPASVADASADLSIPFTAYKTATIQPLIPNTVNFNVGGLSGVVNPFISPGNSAAKDSLSINFKASSEGVTITKLGIYRSKNLTNPVFEKTDGAGIGALSTETATVLSWNGSNSGWTGSTYVADGTYYYGVTATGDGRTETKFYTVNVDQTAPHVNPGTFTEDSTGYIITLPITEVTNNLSYSTTNGSLRADIELNDIDSVENVIMDLDYNQNNNTNYLRLYVRKSSLSPTHEFTNVNHVTILSTTTDVKDNAGNVLEPVENVQFVSTTQQAEPGLPQAIMESITGDTSYTGGEVTYANNKITYHYKQVTQATKDAAKARKIKLKMITITSPATYAKNDHGADLEISQPVSVFSSLLNKLTFGLLGGHNNATKADEEVEEDLTPVMQTVSATVADGSINLGFVGHDVYRTLDIDEDASALDPDDKAYFDLDTMTGRTSETKVQLTATATGSPDWLKEFCSTANTQIGIKDYDGTTIPFGKVDKYIRPDTAGSQWTLITGPVSVAGDYKFQFRVKGVNGFEVSSPELYLTVTAQTSTLNFAYPTANNANDEMLGQMQAADPTFDPTNVAAIYRYAGVPAFNIANLFQATAMTDAVTSFTKAQAANLINTGNADSTYGKLTLSSPIDPEVYNTVQKRTLTYKNANGATQTKEIAILIVPAALTPEQKAAYNGTNATTLIINKLLFHQGLLETNSDGSKSFPTIVNDGNVLPLYDTSSFTRLGGAEFTVYHIEQRYYDITSPLAGEGASSRADSVHGLLVGDVVAIDLRDKLTNQAGTNIVNGIVTAEGAPLELSNADALEQISFEARTGRNNFKKRTPPTGRDDTNIYAVPLVTDGAFEYAATNSSAVSMINTALSPEGLFVSPDAKNSPGNTPNKVAPIQYYTNNSYGLSNLRLFNKVQPGTYNNSVQLTALGDKTLDSIYTGKNAVYLIMETGNSKDTTTPDNTGVLSGAQPIIISMPVYQTNEASATLGAQMNEVQLYPKDYDEPINKDIIADRSVGDIEADVNTEIFKRNVGAPVKYQVKFTVPLDIADRYTPTTGRFAGKSIPKYNQLSIADKPTAQLVLDNTVAPTITAPDGTVVQTYDMRDTVDGNGDSALRAREEFAKAPTGYADVTAKADPAKARQDLRTPLGLLGGDTVQSAQYRLFGGADSTGNVRSNLRVQLQKTTVNTTAAGSVGDNVNGVVESVLNNDSMTNIVSYNYDLINIKTGNSEVKAPALADYAYAGANQQAVYEADSIAYASKNNIDSEVNKAVAMADNLAKYAGRELTLNYTSYVTGYKPEVLLLQLTDGAFTGYHHQWGTPNNITITPIPDYKYKNVANYNLTRLGEQNIVKSDNGPFVTTFGKKFAKVDKGTGKMFANGATAQFKLLRYSKKLGIQYYAGGAADGKQNWTTITGKEGDSWNVGDSAADSNKTNATAITDVTAAEVRQLPTATVLTTGNRYNLGKGIPTALSDVYIDSTNIGSGELELVGLSGVADYVSTEPDNLQALTTGAEKVVYALVEQNKVDGYMLNNNFTIFHAEAGSYRNKETHDGIVEPASSATKYPEVNWLNHARNVDKLNDITYDDDYYIIENVPENELPSTGGHGIYWIIAIGIVLLASGTVYFYLRRRVSVEIVD